jgi:hypothetical protein
MDAEPNLELESKVQPVFSTKQPPDVWAKSALASALAASAASAAALGRPAEKARTSIVLQMHEE